MVAAGVGAEQVAGRLPPRQARSGAAWRSVMVIVVPSALRKSGSSREPGVVTAVGATVVSGGHRFTLVSPAGKAPVPLLEVVKMRRLTLFWVAPGGNMPKNVWSVVARSAVMRLSIRCPASQPGTVLVAGSQTRRSAGELGVQNARTKPLKPATSK